MYKKWTTLCLKHVGGVKMIGDTKIGKWIGDICVCIYFLGRALLVGYSFFIVFGNGAFQSFTKLSS